MTGCVLIGMAAAALAADTGTVAMFRGGPEHRGVYETSMGERPVGMAWMVRTEGPVRSTPLVVDGEVFVGSGDGGLYSIDRRDGAVRWRYDAGAAVASSPALAGGLVLATSRDNVLHAVDRRTGRRVWTAATAADAPWPWGHESGDVYLSSPVVVGERVLFGSGDGGLYAVSLSDGRRLWRYATAGRVRSTPAVAGDVVVVGSSDGRVHFVDLATGRARARHDTEGAGLFSGDFGFDRRSVQSTPAVAGGRVFVGAKDGFLYALDLATGERLWREDHEVSWVVGGPAVVDGVVFTGTSDRQWVQALDAATGRELWKNVVGGTVWTSPAVAGETVYVGSGAGLVFALDRRTGETRWSYRAGGRVHSSPVPDRGLLVFGSDDGFVYALRTGEAETRRAVFWDSTLVAAARYRGSAALRDALVPRGYDVLDAAGLEGFLEARARDGAPSVVVFAMDVLPERVAAADADTVLFRRYLEAGGKAVWVGVPPRIFDVDPVRGFSPLSEVRWTALSAVLDVGHEGAIFDPYAARPTPEGRRWGLHGWLYASWSADPADVVPLALDERGLAAAWVKGYGGPPGTGFVRVWPDIGPVPDSGIVWRAAELRPLP